jgi:uridine monophosphate synthetase
MRDCILKLYDIGAIKFGSFKLKSGITSPIYIDLRLLVSYPHLLQQIADELWTLQEGLEYDLLCGVPYTALPLATALSLSHGKSMVMRRKEAKTYGTKKPLEGVYKAGQRCLIVEDLITSGASILETVDVLEKEGLQVTDAILVLDREQGAVENLRNRGINVHALFTMSEVVDSLREQVEPRIWSEVITFLDGNRNVAPPAPKKLENPCGLKLLQLMEQKETNLSFNADVTKADELFALVDKVGPHICLLKTHIDLLEDFDPEVPRTLRALADKHNFMIFEDRKFADIGTISQGQYVGGMYQILEWADIVNAHPVPGPGIIEGLKNVGLPRGRGLLLLAQMSSKGALATGAYTEAAIKMADEHRDFVMGFVSTERLADGFIHLTPGVKLQEGTDPLGQQYLTPQKVIGERRCDIIQVGRGIATAADPAAEAQKYREAGWSARKATV